MNSTHLKHYARLLVEHGAGVRADQEVFVHGERIHRDLALHVGEAAYDLGARAVNYWFKDPLVSAQRIRRGQMERIELGHQAERQWFGRILASRGALISLRGDEYPDLLAEVARSHAAAHEVYTRGQRSVAVAFHHHGINRSLCPWVVAGAPTAAWAAKVRPALDKNPAAALDRLTELIFRFTFADRDDALQLAAERDRQLHARRRLLDELAIEELRVLGGGSDLRVCLTPQARWLGGSKQTTDGQTFNANLPSLENYTTPDHRLTQGRLAATMPFRTKSGVLVEGLVLEFEDGRVSSFTASRGSEGFARWIDSDLGARQLGEFALVGNDSPIAQSGLFFEHTLLDENAWSHVALGKAYANGLRDGARMSLAQLRQLGCNESVIHTDIMFGSPEVSITASRSRRGAVPLIVRGQWVEELRQPS